MQYHFRAIDAEGHARRGRMIATNPAELERRLTGMGLTLIAHKAESWQRRSALPSFSVSRRDMIHFCLSLEQLMRAGVPLQEGLTDLRDSTDNPRMAEVIAAIIDDIEGGRTLSQAMAAHPRVFNRMVTGLVEAGEAAGMLSDVFARLTTSLKRQDELIAQAKRLVIYPAFLLTLMIGVSGFLMVYLIPQLSDFLRSLQKDLPWQTQLLISVSHFVVDYGLLVLLGCVGGGDVYLGGHAQLAVVCAGGGSNQALAAYLWSDLPQNCAGTVRHPFWDALRRGDYRAGRADLVGQCRGQSRGGQLSD